ncbi:uncharacterized protein LOC143191292 isoform X2 [Rhynchophorus ferrugineus]|uniref:uncharacterized protein LOC143191292 isoform X2 n=1 Tax=Rhynchophorus ferrugineus TaxID=354439 RepID=UPI003FCCA92C
MKAELDEVLDTHPQYGRITTTKEQCPRLSVEVVKSLMISTMTEHLLNEDPKYRKSNREV